VGAEVLGVSTLEAIAQGVPAELVGAEEREVQAVLDAQRRELFVGRFRMEPGAAEGELPRLTRVDADQIVPVVSWLEQLRGGVIVTGAGLTKIEQQLPPGVVVAPKECWEPRASVVGRLAWRDYQAGRREDLWKLAPVYLRPSYAEEKRTIAGTKPGPGVPQ
jgi:tRNA threonylcarbamoyladenosine biosynthesis protein TsaB